MNGELNELISGPYLIQGTTLLDQAISQSLSDINQNINMNGYNIINLATPNVSQVNYAANVQFVLDEVGGSLPITSNLETINTTNPLGSTNLDLTNSTAQLILNDATLAKSAMNRESCDSRYYQSSIPLNSITTPTADLSLNNHKITSLANATLSTDALNQASGDARYYLNTTTLNNIQIPTGSINMNAYTIENLNNPTTLLQASNKQYVDQSITTLGSNSLATISNNNPSLTQITASNQRITNIADPTSTQDAVTKNYLTSTTYTQSQTNSQISSALTPYYTSSQTDSAIASADAATLSSANTTALGYANTAQTNSYTHSDLGLAKRAILTNQLSTPVAMGTLQDLYVNDTLADRNSQHIYYCSNNPVLSNTLDMSQPCPFDYLYNNFPNFNSSISTLTGSVSADLNMNTHKITTVVDPTNAQDVATKNYVDTQGYKPLIQYSNTGSYGSKIVAISASELDFYLSNTLLGKMTTTSVDWVIDAVQRLQLLSDISKISLYGNQTPTILYSAGVNYNATYLSGKDDATMNVSTLLQLVGKSDSSVLLNIASGHLGTALGGATSNSINGISTLGFSFCGGNNPYDSTYNPTGTDFALNLYSAANKTALTKPFSFYFGDYAGYNNSYSVATIDALSSGNVLVPRSYVTSKIASAGGQTFPPSNNLSMGGYQFLSTDAIYSSSTTSTANALLLGASSGSGPQLVYGGSSTAKFQVQATQNVSYQPLNMNSTKITSLATATNPADAVRFDQLPTTTQGTEFIQCLSYNSTFIPTATNYCNQNTWNNVTHSATQNSMTYGSGTGTILLLSGYTYRIQLSIVFSTGTAGFCRLTIMNSLTTLPYLGTTGGFSAEMSQCTNDASSSITNEAMGFHNQIFTPTSAISLGVYMSQISNIATGSGTTDIRYIKWQIESIPNALILQGNSIASNNLTWSAEMNTGGTYGITGLPTPVNSSDACTKGYADSTFATIGTSLTNFSAPVSALQLGGQKISNLANGTATTDACTYLQLTNAIAGFVTNPMTVALNMNTHQINNLTNGSNAQDAVSYSQMNSAISAHYPPELLDSTATNIINFNGNTIQFKNTSQTQYNQIFDLSGFSNQSYLQDWGYYNSSTTNYIKHQYTDRLNIKSPIALTGTESQAVTSYLLDINGALSTSLSKGGLHIGSSSFPSLIGCPIQFSNIIQMMPNSNLIAPATTATAPFFQWGTIDSSAGFSTTQQIVQIGYNTSGGYTSSSNCLGVCGNAISLGWNIYIPISQKQYKKDIKPFQNDKLLNIQFNNFYYDQNECEKINATLCDYQKEQLGFIVEELQEAGLDEYIDKRDNGTLSVLITPLRDDLLAFHQNKIIEHQNTIKQQSQQISDMQTLLIHLQLQVQYLINKQ